jgi:serine/threonine-protein kinase
VASPEQRAGLAVGVASDVYQLGLLLAGLLGAVVEDIAADAAEAARLDGQDRRLRWPDAVAAELRAVVARATRHDPAQRYEGVAGFAEDLQAWLARRPVAAFRSGPAYVVRCFLRRNPALSLVSALSLGLLLGLSAAFTWRLALERDQARAAAGRAEAVSGFLVRLFRDVDPAANRIAAEAARSLVQRGESALADGLATTPDVRAAVLATLGEVNQSLGDFDAAERLARESLAADPGAARAVLAMRQAQLAQALAARGDYDDALAATAAGLATLGDGAAEGAGRARLLAAQANAAQLKGDLALARRSAEALLGVDGDGAATLESRAMARLVLAYAAEQGGDFRSALREADAATAPLALALGREHPRLAALEAYRAYLLLGVDRHAEAGQAADAAVAGLSRVYGGAHARLSYALTNQALARLRTGRPAEARAIGERALSMCRDTLSAAHAQCAVSAQVLATIAQAQGDDGAALELLREVLRVRRATLRADHSYVGFAELQLADALCRAGDTAGARAHLAEADRILPTLSDAAPEAVRRRDVVARCG